MGLIVLSTVLVTKDAESHYGGGDSVAVLAQLTCRTKYGTVLLDGGGVEVESMDCSCARGTELLNALVHAVGAACCKDNFVSRSKTLRNLATDVTAPAED